MIIPNLYAFYTGVILFAMGSRFFTPNSIATLGKVYVDKQKLLNSALTRFILDINIGAFIGGLVFSIVALKYGWEIGFLLGTISNALAFLFLRLAKYKNTIQLFDKPLNLTFTFTKILLVILLSSLFWFIFSSTGSDTYLAFNELATLSKFDYGSDLYFHATLSLFIPISLILAFLWWKYAVHNSINLLIAFGIGAIGLSMLFILPEKLSPNHINNFVIYLICFGLAEVILGPVILTVIFKNTNPRYYASIIGVMLFVVSFAVVLSNKLVDEELNSLITFGCATFLMGSATVSLLIYFLITRFKSKPIQTN